MSFLPLDFLSGFFDLSFIEELGRLPFYLLFWELFRRGGWVIFLYTFLKGFSMVWQLSRASQWSSSQQYVLLAIDVPKDSEQTPKAVENIMTMLAGAHGTNNWYERWIEGQFQLSFSLELISLDGYVQFAIRTPEKFRDLVEAAVYAQYPDAEISEIVDYTDNVPQVWPNNEYKLWGSEYVFARDEVYPIKTWPYFEHPGAEFPFKDPMAAMLEALSTLRVGEQVWIQITVTPISDDWRKAAELVVKKLIKAPLPQSGSGFLSGLVMAPLNIGLEIIGAIIPGIGPFGGAPKKEERTLPSQLIYLPPGEVEQVKGIERKMSKLAFRCKYRWIYIARKEVYNKARGVSATIGAIKQYNTLDMNALKPDKKTWTQAYYLFKNYRIIRRVRKIFRYYKFRSAWAGSKSYILNIEELASLWHFPAKDIRAPLLRRTAGRKGEPPTDLPIDRLPQSPLPEPLTSSTSRPASPAVPQPPISLPIPEEIPEGLEELTETRK